uniref:Uncharacterized protein n=1 Tax=Solanum tuberosum TaxID=4113 RepID=M1BM84_SOLTU
MAGLLAWAADVVGGSHSNDEDDNNPNLIPLIFTPQQQSYLLDLDRKATSLTRTIQDLRLRLPPPDISERLPHLHAHSLASNNALVLQLNAHSATKEQAQLREITLQEENAEYEKAISDYENRIQEKSEEADLLRSKLQVSHNLCCSDSSKMMPHLCQILQKCAIFGEFDTYPSTFLKSPSNIDHNS